MTVINHQENMTPLSNSQYNETGQQLGEGRVCRVGRHSGVKIRLAAGEDGDEQATFQTY